MNRRAQNHRKRKEGVTSAGGRKNPVSAAALWGFVVLAGCAPRFRHSSSENPSVAPSSTTPLFGDATPLTWSKRMATSEMARRGVTLGWSYETGLFTWALFQLDHHVKDSTYRDYATQVISRIIGKDGTIRHYSATAYTLDNIQTGLSVLELHQRTGEARYLAAAQTLRLQLHTQPRTSDSGFWHKKSYPNQMWLDGLYMAQPFLARFGKLYSQPAAFDEVARQFRLMDAHTYHAIARLWYHGWDEQKAQPWSDPVTGTSGNFWGRAIGWYAMGLIDALDYLPKNHPSHSEILKIFHRLADGIVRYQDAATGTWFQVVSQGLRPGNYLEASASSMFTYALAKGVNRGYLGSTYKQAAVKAYAGLVQQFVTHAKGAYSLNRICRVAGLSEQRNGSFEYYIGEAIVSNDLKGIGPFILAGVEVEQLLRSSAASTDG